MGNYSYTRNIPNTPNNPSVDQPSMLINNNSTQDIIATDHIGYNLNNGGAHKQVQIQDQQTTTNGVIPTGLIGNGFETLYTSATNGAGELWFVRGAAATGIQLTGPGTPSAGTNGYTFLPGGLLLQWGIINGTHGSPPKNLKGGDTGTVTFSAANIAFPNNCYGVWANPLYRSDESSPSSQASIAIDLVTLSKSSFSWLFVTGTNNYYQFFWVAIGN